MNVYVYRSLVKNGYYLYVLEEDNFDQVPAALKEALGKLEFALNFALTEDRRLATENPRKVIDNLQSIGYHLQITDPMAAPHLNDKTPYSPS